MVRSLGREDPLEKEMATHSSILAWRIPWTEDAGGLQSRGLQRIGHDCVKTPTHILSSPQDDEPHCDGAYETCTLHTAADRPMAKAGLVPKPCVNAGHSTRAWILAAGVHWGGDGGHQ